MTTYTVSAARLSTTDPGAQGRQAVSTIALDYMGMAGMYGAADDAQSIATIHAALDPCVKLLDTEDFYGAGHDKILIGMALKGRRDQAMVSVKFGAQRAPDGGWGGVDGRSASVKNCLAYTLKRLGTDHIDIYRMARLDPNVPTEDTIGAMADMVEAGHMPHFGLRKVRVETIERAHTEHPIADLQIKYTLISRGPEAKSFPVLKKLGIGVTAYDVLSRGLLAGSKPGAGDIRANLPRFAGENTVKTRKLVDLLQRFAASMHATSSQVAIAWGFAQSYSLGLDMVIALVGSRTLEQLDESLSALQLTLSDEDLQRIPAAFPENAVAGTRYAAPPMEQLDGEKLSGLEPTPPVAAWLAKRASFRKVAPLRERRLSAKCERSAPSSK